MRTFIIAGELSGDTHGAGLMQAMLAQQPGLRFLGLGGPQMKAVPSAVIDDWIAQAAVVGITDVLQRYGYFKQRMAACVEAIVTEQPEAVILIDYPGFNLRLAKALRARGVRSKLLYYISPQVWAWKRGRIKEMARTLDLMVCLFPFEQPLYEKSGLRTIFAGHPMVDRVKTMQRGWQREPGLIGWFPGSREHEVNRLFPVMIEAAKLIQPQHPKARFAVSAANEVLAGQMRAIADAQGAPEAKRWIEVGTFYDLMQRAEVGAVASGTATLEAAALGLPYALIYRVSWPTYALGKMLVHVKHLGIMNIIADREVIPELIQHHCSPKRIAAQLGEWLVDPAKREAQQKAMAETFALLGEGHAYERAAQAMLSAMGSAG